MKKIAGVAGDLQLFQEMIMKGFSYSVRQRWDSFVADSLVEFVVRTPGWPGEFSDDHFVENNS